MGVNVPPHPVFTDVSGCHKTSPIVCPKSFNIIQVLSTRPTSTTRFSKGRSELTKVPEVPRLFLFLSPPSFPLSSALDWQI